MRSSPADNGCSLTSHVQYEALQHHNTCNTSHWCREIQMVLGLSRGSASHTTYQVVDWSDPRNSQCSSGCRCFWAALHNTLYVQSGNYHGMRWERHSDAWGCRTSYARFRSPPEQGSKPLNLGCSKLGWAGSAGRRRSHLVGKR